MKKDKILLLCKTVLVVLYIAIVIAFYSTGIYRGFYGVLPGGAGTVVSFPIFLIFTVIEAIIFYFAFKICKNKIAVIFTLLLISVLKTVMSSFYYWLLDNYFYDIRWLGDKHDNWAIMYTSSVYYGLTVLAFIVEIIGGIRLFVLNKK